MNWNQNANLHPDEYGLTNTITQLHIPKTVSEYFNTRISPISPYQKYDLSGSTTLDGPDNRMRWGQWPIILIRALAEIIGSIGYDELRIMGRYFSAFIDTLTLLLIFLIGRRLYGFSVALYATALSSLAVLQIQQSHFMTVDNFATFFATLSMYSAVRISEHTPVICIQDKDNSVYPSYQIDKRAIKWYLLFGVSFGMAITSKISLLPLGGMILFAAFISITDLKLHYQRDIQSIFSTGIIFILIAILAALITFRVTQPMSFRASTGDTSFWTLHLNPDWVDSMRVAQQESSGIGGGPPAEQWSDRLIVIFPLMNMIVWGMGIPLGIASWFGFCWASVKTLKDHHNWRVHLLPVIWTGGYFIFMATRWVKSIRYFLPIYPFLCLLAAWGLSELIINIHTSSWRIFQKQSYRKAAYLLAVFVSVLVVGGTFVWAAAFTNAVYRHAHTRIQATQWILANVPGPLHIQISINGNDEFIPISAPDGLTVNRDTSFLQSFTSQHAGELISVTLPHISNTTDSPIYLNITLSLDPEGTIVIDRTSMQIPPSSIQRGIDIHGNFQGAELEAGQTYYLTASTPSTNSLMIYRNIIANEDWDEGLPVPFAGYDPYGQLYRGITMPVRWTDDQNKRKSFLDNLEHVDFIILPSQRSIWSISRLQSMYPMTIEYYRALFDGRLGFDQVAMFQSPFKIGALEISDVGGVAAWNARPEIPCFNFNIFAAEEAFSVYDHPPVWIFEKRHDFSLLRARNILNTIDLSTAVFQSPRDANVSEIK